MNYLALLLLTMPAIPKRQAIRDAFAIHIHKTRCARFRQLINELNLDLCSDTDTESNASNVSTLSTISIVSLASCTSSIDSDASSIASSTFSELEHDSHRWWERKLAHFQLLLDSVRVLKPGTLVTKHSQLSLYFDDFRYTSPTRFHRKLQVSPTVFDELVWLIETDPVFSNNSNVPQFPVPIQLAIFLVCIGHYGNTASPEDIAQWAGVSMGMVENSTHCCLVAFLRMHDTVVMFPTEDEKENAKHYVEALTCPEWWNGFLLTDGTKFLLFQKPGHLIIPLIPPNLT